jgi:hypothetical protein
MICFEDCDRLRVPQNAGSLSGSTILDVRKNCLHGVTKSLPKLVWILSVIRKWPMYLDNRVYVSKYSSVLTDDTNFVCYVNVKLSL